MALNQPQTQNFESKNPEPPLAILGAVIEVRIDNLEFLKTDEIYQKAKLS